MTLVAGVGNVLRGDDAIGVQVIAELLADGVDEKCTLLDCGVAPESFIGVFEREKNGKIILIDAVDMGLTPGVVEIVDRSDDINMFEETSSRKASDIVSGQTDKLLGMLDSYSSQLVDPDISLKSIAPIVEEINHNAGNLLKETKNLTDSDISLKEIANQTVIAAQTEYFKFQRGDYLS